MLTRQDIVRNFTLNVEKERIKRNLTQSQMAKKLEMSLSGYKKMISGVTAKIDLYTVQLMHNLTGKWIFELIDDYREETEIILKLKEMSEAQRNFINNMIEFESYFSSVHEDSNDYITVFIPTENMVDGMIYDSANFTKINAASYRKKFGEDLFCGIKITSDHLKPVYNLGDILLICRKAVREGDTGIFLNKETGKVYIRKLRPSSSRILEPINDCGEPLHIDSCDESAEKWINFGYVLTKIRG